VRRFAPQLFAQLSCISLALFSISDAQAQGPRSRITKNQVQDGGEALENLRRQARIQPVHRDRRVDHVSLRNDFRQIQIVNNDLMKRVFGRSATKKITNKEIRSSLGEIKKLAERLAASFGIPTKKTQSTTEVALTTGLLQLDKAIVSFVDNPMFEQLRVYDTDMVSQAGKDLSEVLRLADALRSLTKDD
jgi:hypothetical protein